MDLAADGRVRQMKLFGRRRNAPLFGHNPKIEEVVVVEPFHGQENSASSRRKNSKNAAVAFPVKSACNFLIVAVRAKD